MPYRPGPSVQVDIVTEVSINRNTLGRCINNQWSGFKFSFWTRNGPIGWQFIFADGRDKPSTRSIWCISSSWFSEIGKGRLTVGKIYGGLLILENWKATKFGRMAMSDSQVTTSSSHIYYILLQSSESISGYGVSSFELQNQFFFTLTWVEFNTVFTPMQMCRYYKSSDINFAKDSYLQTFNGCL